MSTRPEPRDAAETEALVEAVLGIAIHRHLGLGLVRHGEGMATLAFNAGPETQTNTGAVHGGVLSLLFEPAALIALIPLLGRQEYAATVDISVSLMSAVPAGAQVRLDAKVLRRGRSLAFVAVEAEAEGRVCAAARITKAIFTTYGR